MLQFARSIPSFPVSLMAISTCLKRRNNFLRRLFIASTVFFAFCLGYPLLRSDSVTLAQQSGSTSTAGSKKAQKTDQTNKADKNQKTFTGEQVAESAIFLYGSRLVLAHIRHNGLERGRICKPTCDVPGKTEEATYEHRFVRGENTEKDKIRIDQKMPTLEYSLIYGGGRLWGLINGSVFTPRQDAADTFLAQQRHSLDTLLRYKENGSTLNLIGKDKQKGLDLYVLRFWTYREFSWLCVLLLEPRQEMKLVRFRIVDRVSLRRFDGCWSD